MAEPEEDTAFPLKQQTQCPAQVVGHPEFHDKVEFEIAFTCYTFDLPERVKILLNNCFTEDECACLTECLRDLTNSIICEDGLWKKDAAKIEILGQKRQEIINSGLGTGYHETLGVSGVDSGNTLPTSPREAREEFWA